MLGEAGFTIISGAGGGVMEAANRGAHEAGARSLGLNINFQKSRTQRVSRRQLHLPLLLRPEDDVREVCMRVCDLPGRLWDTRRAVRIAHACADDKLTNFPLVLVDRNYWQPLLGWLKTSMVERGFIRDSELDLFVVLDEPGKSSITSQMQFPASDGIE